MGEMDFAQLATSLDAIVDETAKKPKFTCPCPVEAGNGNRCPGILVAKDFGDEKPALICSAGCLPEVVWTAITRLQARLHASTLRRDREAGETPNSPAVLPRAAQIDEVMRRLPPQNIQAEQAVLGAVFIDPEALATAKSVLGRDDFYRETHREIFRAMEGLVSKGKPIDAITIVQALRGAGTLDQVGGPAYLTELADTAITANIRSHAEIVKD